MIIVIIDCPVLYVREEAEEEEKFRRRMGGSSIRFHSRDFVPCTTVGHRSLYNMHAFFVKLLGIESSSIQRPRRFPCVRSTKGGKVQGFSMQYLRS